MEIAQRELRSEVIIDAIAEGDSLVKRLMTSESRVLRRTDQIGVEHRWDTDPEPSFWDRLRTVAG